MGKPGVQNLLYELLMDTYPKRFYATLCIEIMHLVPSICELFLLRRNKLWRVSFGNWGLSAYNLNLSLNEFTHKHSIPFILKNSYEPDNLKSKLSSIRITFFNELAMYMYITWLLLFWLWIIICVWKLWLFNWRVISSPSHNPNHISKIPLPKCA